MNDRLSDPLAPNRVEAGQLRGRATRYFDFMMAGFVTILLLSN